MNNIIVSLCIILGLLGNSLWVNAQETSSSSPEEQPPELTMEQVCEQSADADGVTGKAREAYMSNCLASWTNVTPEEEDSPQDSDDQEEQATDEKEKSTNSAKSTPTKKNKEQHSQLVPQDEKHPKEKTQK